MFAMLVGGFSWTRPSSSLLEGKEKGEVVECRGSCAYSIEFPSIMLSIELRMSSNLEHIVQSLLNMYFCCVRS